MCMPHSDWSYTGHEGRGVIAVGEEDLERPVPPLGANHAGSHALPDSSGTDVWRTIGGQGVLSGLYVSDKVGIQRQVL